MRPAFITSLSELMDGRAADFGVVSAPNSDAIVWRDFRDAVTNLTTVLVSHPGQYFGLYYEDIYDFAVALMGVLHAGKRPVLLPHIKPEFLAGLSGILDGLLVGEDPRSSQIPVVTLPRAAKASGPLPAMPDDAVIYLCTSGTTGAPTLIEKPLACLENEVAVQNETFGPYDLSAPVAGSVSHQHIYGLLFRLLCPMMRGQLIWRPMIRFPEEIAALPEASVLVSSPAFLKRAVTVPGFTRNASRLSACFSSGGPLAEDVARILLAEAGQAPNEIFGSTETGGIAWRNIQAMAPDNRWRLFKGIKARIDDDRLTLHSPFIPSDPPYVTSDLARLCEDGGLELLGRADRIAKVEEKRISLTALERSLAENDLVEEAAVLVLKDEGRTRLGAAVTPSTKGWAFIASSGRRALISFLSEKLAQGVEDIAIPRRWRFVKTLPRNTQGKVMASDLEALFTGQENLRPALQHVHAEGDTVTLTLPITSNVFYFKGHFPGTPILPGVAQLGWAAQFADEYFAVGKTYKRIEVLKFQQLIRPRTQVTLTLTHNKAKNNVAFAFDSVEGRHSSGRIVYEQQDGA